MAKDRYSPGRKVENRADPFRSGSFRQPLRPEFLNALGPLYEGERSERSVRNCTSGKCDAAFSHVPEPTAG
jgi:hypothetical protein